MSKKLIIVSNRLPFNIKRENGKLTFTPSVGGLATGLKSYYKTRESLWLGYPGLGLQELDKGEIAEIISRLAEDRCKPVFLEEEDYAGYYNGFANKTLWPLFHYFSETTVYDPIFWEKYKKVNEIFCEEILKVAGPRDEIWVQDYHLMLLPAMLREKLPEANIGYFLHIPFPSSEIFRLLPRRQELLEGVLGSDLIGFHTYDYVRHFLESVRRIVGFEHVYGAIQTSRNMVKVDAFPIGIDYDKFAEGYKNPKVIEESKKISFKKDQKVIITIDRLDYTKGIPRRLEAFKLFLGKYPEYHGKVTMVMISAPSRTNVESYENLKHQVNELVGSINGAFGTISWTPVIYYYRAMPFETICALYNVADVTMVTPIRDGMNIVAKEFVASKKDMRGVLILSETAGAAQELSEAIMVNPNNRDQMADAIKEGLEMDEEEQIERNSSMQKRIRRYDVRRWANDFMEMLQEIKTQQQRYLSRNLDDNDAKELINTYKQSEKRLLLIDYDGTLVGFKDKPQDAKPDDEVNKIIKQLTYVEQNRVYVISGRPCATLEKWFGHLRVGMIAEHGVWIREIGEEWKTIFPLNNDWMKEIQPIFQLFADRTPGAFVEEKDYSLVWHYRNVNPSMANVRVNELKHVLVNLTENLNLGVMDGNKIIEVKNLNVNKGSAAMTCVEAINPEFIFAIGDDFTDEDMFRALPKEAYTIRVGFPPSHARFNLQSVRDVRDLLNKIGKAK
ncbi:MAG: bifunctional alpha,alpha-trehalose-phosphate synthase (UDP-forming)/trehalose-phosphatase [Bacteroidota bacterium]